jgi:putative tricarboxylic transport membrane protein
VGVSRSTGTIILFRESSLRANDILSGLALIVFSLAMIALTLTFPDFPGQKFGPALFPRILGVGLTLCGAVLIRNGLAARRAGAPWLEHAPWTRDPWRVTSFLATLALLVVYILASESVGFIPIALVFLLVLFVWLGVRFVPAVLTAVVTTIAIYWFFSTMLRVPLPRGWLDAIL